MGTTIKMFFRQIVVTLARFFGRAITDQRTGQSVGRAFVWPGKSGLHLVGLNDAPLVPFFSTQERTTYWKQILAFRSHPPPDFVSLHPDGERPEAKSTDQVRIALVILGHLEPVATRRAIDRWKSQPGISSVLVAHGGSREDFEALDWPDKVHLDSPRLRTTDHQRERQSYQQVLQQAARWLRSLPNAPDGVLFVEYDHLPLTKQAVSAMWETMISEKADVMTYRLWRIEDTCLPHWLSHHHDPRFGAFWQKVSKREDPRVILSGLGTGHLWRTSAFLAVADFPEPFPIYLELWLPTAAHHLGFRVRSWPANQHRWVRPYGDYSHSGLISPGGAWTIHPVKNSEIWTAPTDSM